MNRMTDYLKATAAVTLMAAVFLSIYDAADARQNYGVNGAHSGSNATLNGEALETMVSRSISRNVPSGLRQKGVGFFVDWDGHLLTASHVVLACKGYEISDDRGNVVDALLVGTDTSLDIALLRATSTIADPYVVENYRFSRAEDFNAVAPIRQGEIAEVTRVNAFGSIQLPRRKVLRISPALDAGNSGGPLYNNFGGVTAVVVGKWGPSGREESIAVPGSLINDFLAYHQVTRIRSSRSSRGSSWTDRAPDWMRVRQSVMTVKCKT